MFPPHIPLSSAIPTQAQAQAEPASTEPASTEPASTEPSATQAYPSATQQLTIELSAPWVRLANTSGNIYEGGAAKLLQKFLNVSADEKRKGIPIYESVDLL